MNSRTAYYLLCIGITMYFAFARVVAQDVSETIGQLERKPYVTRQEREILKQLYDEQMKHIEIATTRGIYFDPERARAGAQEIERIKSKRDAIDATL
jgi:hypothetical protein